MRRGALLLLLFAQSAIAQAPLPGIAMTGSVFTYTVLPGDSLTKIGARFGMETWLLARANGLSANAKLKPGQMLEVDNRHIVPAGLDDGIVINLPQRMLFRLVGGEVQLAYPVAAGKPTWTTPRGDFVVATRESDKTWFVPPSIQQEMALEGKEVLQKVLPGPDNPLGRHWLGLSIPGIGIHGTIAPQSIYHLQSHGCIRLHPDDVAELFEAVQKGDPGRVIYQPVLLYQAPGGKIFLEVHRDAYKKGVEAHRMAWELAESAGVYELVNWDTAALVIDAREGVARDVTLATDGEIP